MENRRTLVDIMFNIVDKFGIGVSQWRTEFIIGMAGRMVKFSKKLL